MRCRPSNGDHQFFKDFTDQLDKEERHRLALRPVFPQPAWWKRLAAADELDVARHVSWLNARDDATYFSRQRIKYVPVIHAAQDGHPQMVDPHPQPRRLGPDGRPLMSHATKWESTYSRDYGAERYVPRPERGSADKDYFCSKIPARLE
jgi:hypothetical protein